MTTDQIERVLTLRSVAKRTGVSESTVIRLVKRKKFPQPFKIIAGRNGWLIDSVDQWIDGRVKADREKRAKADTA